MIDVSLSRTVIAVAVIVAVIVLARRRAEAGQRELLVEIRTLIRIKRMELELAAARETAARESAAREDDADARVAAIVAEIQAGPYVRHHVRPDLPGSVGVLHIDTPSGPCVVTGPARRCRNQARRRARQGYRGLAALPAALGLVWRSMAASTQVSAVAAMAVMPVPPLPSRAAEPPPSIVFPNDAPGRGYLPVPSVGMVAPPARWTPGPNESDDARDTAPEPPPTPDAPPLLDSPSPTTAPSDQETEPPAPSTTPTPSPSATVSPSPSPSPTASPSPTVASSAEAAAGDESAAP